MLFCLISTTEVDSEGNYLFDNVLPNQEDLYIVISNPGITISAMDETPDGDENENISGQIWIGIFLEEGEDDDGNNFVINQESCETSTVTGRVFGIIAQDTTSLPSNVIINLYETNSNGDLINLVGSVETMDAFSFVVANNFSGIIEIDYTNVSDPLMPIAIAAIDQSPDDDPLFGNEITHLPVELDSCEIDSDNNFILLFETYQLSISGSVLLDIDEDNIGDVTVENQAIELYTRNANNEPTSTLLRTSSTNQNGVFEFYDVPEGEYIIKFLGDGQYTVIAGFDEDQESGEPTNNQPQYISVNIANSEDLDQNNMFILSTQSDCTAMPSIFPYPALCDTSIICTYDQLPVYVIDEMGNPLTTAGGIYQLVWTDLLTGQSQQGDWTFQKTNHPVQLSITYPDGCEYIVNYLRDCEQDLNGEFSMVSMTTGFGPTYDYDTDEVIWTFEPFDNEITIAHNITNTTNNPNLIPAGKYSYNLTETMDKINLTLEDADNGTFYDVGNVEFQNGLLILDDDIAADGIGRFFQKN